MILLVKPPRSPIAAEESKCRTISLVGFLSLIRVGNSHVNEFRKTLRMSSCRAAGERRPERKRDESPGETKAVSPGAARKRWHPSKKKAPDESGAGEYGTLSPRRNYAALCFLAAFFFGGILTSLVVSFDLLTLFGLEDLGCGGANAASASDNGSGSFSRGMPTWSMRARRLRAG